jgi:hypothetical protein
VKKIRESNFLRNQNQKFKKNQRTALLPTKMTNLRNNQRSKNISQSKTKKSRKTRCKQTSLD